MLKKRFASSIGLCFNLINTEINKNSNFINFFYIMRFCKVYRFQNFVPNLVMTYKSSKIDLKPDNENVFVHYDRWKDVVTREFPVRLFPRIPDAGSFPQADHSNVRQNVPEASQAIWFGSRLTDKRKSFAVVQLAHPALIYRLVNRARVWILRFKI